MYLHTNNIKILKAIHIILCLSYQNNKILLSLNLDLNNLLFFKKIYNLKNIYNKINKFTYFLLRIMF